MSNFHWTHYAMLAKNIAKRINDGTEVNKDGVRLDAIRDKQDIYATDALNRMYANKGSKASIHTYWGGAQEISTQHADGSKGLFRTGERSQPTNNEMDREVENYMNNSIKESTNMKQTIKLNESQLRQIISEAIRTILSEGQLNELDPRTYAAARDEQNRRNQEYDQQMQAYNAMNPIKRAFTKAPQAPKGYNGRANSFNKAAVNRFNTMYGGTTDGIHMSDNGNVNVTRDNGNEQNVTTYNYNANQNKAGVNATGRGRGVVTNTAYNKTTGQETKGPSYGMTNADADYRLRGGSQTPTARDKAVRTGAEMAGGYGKYVPGKGWQ